jgi:hypothetical protein
MNYVLSKTDPNNLRINDDFLRSWQDGDPLGREAIDDDRNGHKWFVAELENLDDLSVRLFHGHEMYLPGECGLRFIVSYLTLWGLERGGPNMYDKLMGTFLLMGKMSKSKGNLLVDFVRLNAQPSLSRTSVESLLRRVQGRSDGTADLAGPSLG